MRDHDRAMVNYLALAYFSRRKSQQIGRDRCLVLGAIAALRAGYPDIADECRQHVVASNPRHLLAGYTSLAEAILAEDAGTYFRQLERHCSYERAEHLFQEVQAELASLAANDGTTIRDIENSTPNCDDAPMFEDGDFASQAGALARDWLTRLGRLDEMAR